MTPRPLWVSVPAVRVATFVTTLAEPVAVVAILAIVSLASLALAATALLTGWVTLSTVDATAGPGDPAAALTEPGEPLDGAASSTVEVIPPTVAATGVTVAAAC